MAKQDELDRGRAAEFAWGAMPADAVTADDADVVSDEAAFRLPGAKGKPFPRPLSKGGDGGEQRRSAEARCADFTERVARAWEIADFEEQGRATSELFSRAVEIGLDIGFADPLNAVRFVRLLVRHRATLPQTTGDGRGAALLYLPLEHSEAAELVVELARSGDPQLCSSLRFLFAADQTALPAMPGISARLGAIVDEGPTWAARCAAIDFAISLSDTLSTPVLLRALATPHLGLRTRALGMLVQHFPQAITSELVIGQLEDVVSHRDPFGDDERSKIATRYGDLLEEAIVRLAPPRAADLLARIDSRDCAGGIRSQLGPLWALGVLARAYVDVAVPLIDARLASSHSDDRLRTVVGVVKLPPDLARPRLRLLALDGDPLTSDGARGFYFTVLGEPYPGNETDAIPEGVLDHEPSEKLRAWLLGLRGPIAARRKLARALLDLAPDPEALAALIVATDGDDLEDFNQRHGLPRTHERWCAELYDRFGSRAVDGLCALAQRHPGNRMGGWIHRLDNLARDRDLSETDRRKIQIVGASAFEKGGDPYRALETFARVGIPPELHEPLWRLVVEPGTNWIDRKLLGEAFRKWVDPARLEEDAAVAMRAALAAADYALVARLAYVAPMAEGSETRSIFLRSVPETSDDVVFREWAVTVMELHNIHAFVANWMSRAFEAPETQAFGIAAYACRHSGHVLNGRALRRALASTAREGAAAAEAAAALLTGDALGPRSARIRMIFERAPLLARAHLLGSMLTHHVSLGRVWPLVEEILTSADPSVTLRLHGYVDFLPWKHERERLSAIALRVVDEVLCGEFEERTQSVARWVDGEEP